MSKRKRGAIPSNEELEQCQTNACRRYYGITVPIVDMNSIDLIEWLAQIAHDGKQYWHWIRKELLRRLDAAQSTKGEKAK